METSIAHQGRTAQIWRAGGMIWLISVTFFFALLDLYFAKLALFPTLFIGTFIFSVTAFVFTWSIKTLIHAKNIPDEKSGDEIRRGSFIRKSFLVTLIIEVLGLNIATLVLLKLNHFQFVVPVDILIVAVHFIPLGRIFAMPIYYFLGIIVSSIAISTMFLVSATSHLGNLITLAAIPSLCFIFLNWMTITYVLGDGMKYLKKRQI